MDMEAATHIELLDGQVVINPTELLSRSRARDEDVVVLSGTLLEGFGNFYSDLDLYVICDRLPKKAPGAPPTAVIREDGRVRRINETLAISSNILLDVQYYTFRELDTLSRSLNTLYQESRQGTQIFRKTLHHEDEDLIHKILTGKILQDGASAFKAQHTFDSGKFCFLKYRNEVGGYEEFRDLIGSWTAGDLDTCLYNTRTYLLAQVSGMLFLAGSTNPRPKWFVKRLAALDAQYAALKDGVMFWLNSPHRTEQHKRGAIEMACDLMDITYSHVRRLLTMDPKYFTPEDALLLTEQEFTQRAKRDRDSLAEWRLRRRIFSATEPPMITQFPSTASTQPARMDAPCAASL